MLILQKVSFFSISSPVEEGMLRIDGIHIMKQIIQNDIPNDISTRLESGYYLVLPFLYIHCSQYALKTSTILSVSPFLVWRRL